MTLIKTFVLTAVSTVIRIISGFIINKILSIYVGPSGLALVGQFQNFSSIVTTFSNGAITQGIVKYVAEYKDIGKKQKIFSTSTVITLVCSFLISMILILFNDYWSLLILKTNEYNNVFTIFGFTIFLYALNINLLSILNGQKEIEKYILVNILSSIFLLFFTFLLTIKFYLLGALYALVLNQSIVFFITLALSIKSKWFNIKYFLQGVDKDILKKLGKFSLMAITSAIAVPTSHIIVRGYIGNTLGWDSAGYWQGIWYVSNVYLMVITTALGVYYLPRLSEIKDKNELKKEIIYGYKIIMPIVIILALSIYIYKEVIVKILFTEKFMPMLTLFKWQLIGDVIKIASWLLGNLMWAKEMAKLFIGSEIFFSLTWVILSLVCVKHFGLIGVTYAFTLNYFMYFLFLFLSFRRVLL